ncbi:MAG: hypothetical protein LH468_06540 [Nocardioides sp.]|nr:hypothetical protein [Nocardioides sp.]
MRRAAADPEAEEAAVRAAYLSAVRHGPRHRGVAFRGRPAGVVAAEGDVVVTSGLLATSLDLRVATENLTAAGIDALLTRRRGRLLGSLAVHPEEQGFVVLPETRLVVVGTLEAAGTPVVVWVEDGPAAGDEPTPAQIGAYAVRRMRGGAAVRAGRDHLTGQVHRPGRLSRRGGRRRRDAVAVSAR